MKKVFLSFPILLLLFSCSVPIEDQTNEMISQPSFATELRETFVFVQTTFIVKLCSTTYCEEQKFQSTSSGFVVKKHSLGGDVVTAGHSCSDRDLEFQLVILGLNGIRSEVRTEFRVFSNEGHEFTNVTLSKVSRDDVDLCLLTIDSTSFASYVEAVELADAVPKYGEPIFNVSTPHFNFFQDGVIPFFHGNYVGLLKTFEMNKDRYPVNAEFMVYSMPAGLGSSGSAVFDANGKVIGIITMVNSQLPSLSYGPSVSSLRSFLSAS